MSNSTHTAASARPMRVSQMAENLIGSEIIKLAGEIRERISKGERIYNFTIGDFDPSIFPIPAELKQLIIEAYQANETNYPAADGMVELRKEIKRITHAWQGLDYAENEMLVAGGARPLIYAIFQALVDPGDTVVFPVPSWNNNHYTHLTHARQVYVETTPSNNFMPTADELKEHLQGAHLLALCSPLNPTGTVFGEQQLADICDLVVQENARRGPDEKPLYVMYDQIYWQLTFGNTRHYDPVNLRAEMRPYTIYVDGMSKSFAATGVRIGWAFGPAFVIDKMKSILGHVGAWSPKAEQMAASKYLRMDAAVHSFMEDFKQSVSARLQGFYDGIQALKSKGFAVDAISPMAAIYLTVQFDLKGKRKPDGQIIASTSEITSYLLSEAHLAVVPFNAFGASKESTWYRLSVGTASMEDVQQSIHHLELALSKLS